jgi:hypothetical protein
MGDRVCVEDDTVTIECLKICLTAYVTADGFVFGMRTRYVDSKLSYVWTERSDGVKEIL